MFMIFLREVEMVELLLGVVIRFIYMVLVISQRHVTEGNVRLLKRVARLISILVYCMVHIVREEVVFMSHMHHFQLLSSSKEIWVIGHLAIYVKADFA